MNIPERARRLNQPMLARLRQCAADTSPNWDGKITIYPNEAQGLVDLIDAVLGNEAEKELVNHANDHQKMVDTIAGCTWCPPLVAGFPEILPPHPVPGHGEPAAFGTVHVLSSGEYSTYRVHCVMANEADAVAAAQHLNGNSYGDYFAEELPLMAAGRLPRKVPLYRAYVSVATVEGRDEVRTYPYEVWEWEKHPACEEVAGRRWPAVAEFRGLDQDLVLSTALERLAVLRAEKTDGSAS